MSSTAGLNPADVASKMSQATVPKKPCDYEDEKFEDEEEEKEEEEGEEEEGEEEEEEEEEGEEEEEEEEDEEDSEDEDEPTLAIKIAREGEPNVKVFVIKKHTKRDALLQEIVKRFGYTSEADFVLYTVDESEDRVDIDNASDLKMATRRFWKNQKSKKEVCRFYIREAEGVARPKTSMAATSKLLGDLDLQSPVTPLTNNKANSSSSQRQDSSSLTPATMVASYGGARSAPAVALSSTIGQGKLVNWNRLSLLGKGSFGTVYEGITSDGALVAVKVQELPLDDESSTEVKNLMSEINLMKQLDHKNIVSYYGCQTRESESRTKQMEIFLEYCSGGSMSTIRKKFDPSRGRLAMGLVRSYTHQILEGLEYLHQRGVMHRDIKGDNVLISATGVAKLADFGCSKRIGTATMAAASEQGRDALSQTMVGTPLFMAPEVMNDCGPGYSKPADIWSIGCLVIEMLGAKPWNIVGNNLFQIMYQISQSKEMPTGIPKDTPPQVMSFLTACFERDASRRATATQLLQHPWMTCPEEKLEDYLPAANSA